MSEAVKGIATTCGGVSVGLCNKNASLDLLIYSRVRLKRTEQAEIMHGA